MKTAIEYGLILAIVMGVVGVAFAQFTPPVQLPNCNFNWACAKVIGQTACSCTNPITNAVQDFIYTPQQVNALVGKESGENALVNQVVNAE